jgi:hypothetical protein
MDAETTVQGSFESLRQPESLGSAAAALALEEAPQVDFEHPEVVYALKCVNWWLERGKRLAAIGDGYERGEFILAQWKAVLRFLWIVSVGSMIVVFMP